MLVQWISWDALTSKMKKNLLLITDGFPYGDKERSFISAEYEKLSEAFNISIVALTANTQITNSIPKCVSYQNLTWNKGQLLSNAFRIFSKECQNEISEAKKCLLEHGRAVRRIIRHELIADVYEKWLLKYLKKNKTDIIYTYWCTSATLAAVRISKKHPEWGIKVVSRFHGYDLYNERTEGANWQPYRGEISEGLNKLVFISRAGMDYYKHTWQVDETKCTVSYLGTKEYDRLSVNDALEKFAIVSCSECIPLKRVENIIEALAHLDEKSKVHWLHVGDGQLLDRLKLIARDELANKNNVSYEFVGKVDHSKLSDVYAKAGAQMFITLSSTEGLPISVTEAIAMGLPVIATDVGGMKELVNETDGYLVNPDTTAENVAEIIVQHMHKTQEERQRMSDNAYSHWKTEFDAVANSDRFVKMLCDL